MRITVKQMESLYGVHPGTQWIWRKEERLPFIKGAKEISYEKEIIQKLALENKLNTKAYNRALALKDTA